MPGAASRFCLSSCDYYFGWLYGKILVEKLAGCQDGNASEGPHRPDMLDIPGNQHIGVCINGTFKDPVIVFLCLDGIHGGMRDGNPEE